MIAELKGTTLDDLAEYGRGGHARGWRKPGGVGFHSLRAGDITSDHKVYFGGLGERLEITHYSYSDDCFARGRRRLRPVPRRQARRRLLYPGRLRAALNASREPEDPLAPLSGAPACSEPLLQMGAAKARIAGALRPGNALEESAGTSEPPPPGRLR